MLAEADFDTTAAALGRARPGDDNLVVHFYTDAQKNDTKSDEEQRPVYENVDFICIMVPGDKDSIIRRKANAIDKARFRKQYEAFKAGAAGPVFSGTPLKLWPLATPAIIAELAFFNIHTVEQLVNMADVHAQKFRGAAQLRSRAKDFLDHAAGTAPITHMREENEKLKAQLDALQGQFNELVEQMTKKKGRKAAEAEEE